MVCDEKKSNGRGGWLGGWKWAQSNETFFYGVCAQKLKLASMAWAWQIY